MNADEIVATIRKLVPCINDCMDLYEYERQALTQAADLIASQQAEIDRLTTENEQLAIHGGKYMKIAEYRYELFAKCADELEQAELRNDGLTALNKEALELLGLAENDVKSICKFCTHQLASERCTKCTSDHWQWLHNHRYEALKKRMEVTP